MTPPQITILSLGWGVQSWTLAAMSALGELPPLDYAIHADTTWEREDTYTFAAEWTPWLEQHGVKVTTVQAKRASTTVYTSEAGVTTTLIPAFTLAQNGAQGQMRRTCTYNWKIDPQNKEVNAILRRLKIKKAPGIVTRWLGISLDEWKRARASVEPHIINTYPLIERKMTRADCIAWLNAHGLPVPNKSACVFCPFHNRRAWEELKREGGGDWDRAVTYDTAIRGVRRDAHATKPIDIFVHTARVPLAEAVQIPEDHGMQQPDMFGQAEDDELATCDSGHCFL